MDYEPSDEVGVLFVVVAYSRVARPTATRKEKEQERKEKKRKEKKKTDKKAPASCEMKRIFSVLLSGCGGLVACFFSVRTKIWI